jgi:hypothetical protein
MGLLILGLFNVPGGDQLQTLPPVACNWIEVFGQMVVVGVMVIGGLANVFTTIVSDAVQEFSVTATKYVPGSKTWIEGAVLPVLH